MAYILIIDDDRDFADAAAIALGDAGYEVGIEQDPNNVVANMKNRVPDLVGPDVMFPEDPSAGFGLARDIRHDHEKLKDVPLLMLTAVNTRLPLGFSSRDIDDTWMPVSEFLEKPVDFGTLREKVESLLQKTSD